MLRRLLAFAMLVVLALAAPVAMAQPGAPSGDTMAAPAARHGDCHAPPAEDCRIACAICMALAAEPPALSERTHVFLARAVADAVPPPGLDLEPDPPRPRF
ncbi:MAG: hypothetical protein ACK41C_06625 [Phenylobacterium sp.]|uniref:hypothetical protein n=1 Tax=Phenylobacterium sp. TaxID=1871053 RepID=UPI0039196DD8